MRKLHAIFQCSYLSSEINIIHIYSVRIRLTQQLYSARTPRKAVGLRHIILLIFLSNFYSNIFQKLSNLRKISSRRQPVAKAWFERESVNVIGMISIHG